MEDAIKRHKELHSALDELLACFIRFALQEPSDLRILDQPICTLLEFSYRQCSEPQCAKDVSHAEITAP